MKQKEFILKKFVKAMNNRARKYKYELREDLQKVHIRILNLNCIIILVENEYDRTATAAYKFDIKNNLVENCDYRVIKSKDDVFEVISFKKEGFFIITHNGKVKKIEGKCDENLKNSHYYYETIYEKETGYLKTMLRNDMQKPCSSIIDLNNNRMMKFSENKEFLIDKEEVFTESQKKSIFKLDIDNKKIFYKTSECKTSLFKINKNDYYIEEFKNFKLNDEYEIAKIYLKTKKNTSKVINLLFNNKTNEISINEIIDNYESLINYNNKMYSFERGINHIEELIFENGQIKKEIVNFDYDKKNDFELKTLCSYLSNRNFYTRLSTGYIQGASVYSVDGYKSRYFVFSKVNETMFIFEPNSEKKFFYFNAKKIINVVDNFETRRFYSLSSLEQTELVGNVFSYIDNIFKSGNYLVFKIKDEFVTRNDRNYIREYYIKQTNYYFDLKSNFIEKVIINGDNERSICNDTKNIIKRLKKNDKTVFKVNNLRMTLKAKKDLANFKGY